MFSHPRSVFIVTGLSVEKFYFCASVYFLFLPLLTTPGLLTVDGVEASLCSFQRYKKNIIVDKGRRMDRCSTVWG